MSDLQSALGKLFPELPKIPPNFRYQTVAELWERYTTELENRCVVDQCGAHVYFLAENFPHLVKLEFYDKKQRLWVDAVAGPTIERLRNKSLDERRHRISDPSRARTLFWLPDVIRSSDSIHDHIEKPEMDIYVRKYKRDEKLDSLKFVLVETRSTGQRVVKTSFWTHEQYLKRCAIMPAKHQK